MDVLHVPVHLVFGDGPSAVRTHDLLAFHEFLAPALVADWEPTITNFAQNAVLAVICMALVEPTVAIGTLQAFGKVGPHELARPKRFSTFRTDVL